MSEAVVPKWHGDNYQARIFWENALNLLDSTSCVVEVAFEANGPKAFDDVVVKYDPAVARVGPERVSAEYHQVKWHVELGGRFGYKDLTDPGFIGATTNSLLSRLKSAKEQARSGARFTFVTTYRIRDDDPLSFLVSGNDKSLLLDKLFDGTGDRSRTGKVRKCWREHLGLQDDETLRGVLDGLRILEGHRSLHELRENINLRAKVVGLMTCSDANSDFRYDELARALKARRLNSFTKESFLQLCKAEGLWVGQDVEPDAVHVIAIRSFLGLSADVVGADAANTLLLTDKFRQRYLRDDLDWQRDIRPEVHAFLRAAATKSATLRLILDAHASIAFLAGSVLDLKSGVKTELVQKGRVGTRVWCADDQSESNRPPLTMSDVRRRRGKEIALAINMTHSVNGQAGAYIAARLPRVGRTISFDPRGGPGQQSVAGGGHAAAVADQISQALRGAKEQDPEALVHIFAACPNSVLFYLGQHNSGIAPCIVYEFDFDRRGNKTYHPSFAIK